MKSAKYNSKLISFLYQLMRDELPPGIIEKLVKESQVPDCTFTNGYLADYAKDVADRLTDPVNKENTNE